MAKLHDKELIEIDRLKKEIENYEAWFRAIDEYADFDMWFKDSESTYRFVNKKFEKALGRSRDELLGKKPSDVFSEPDRVARVKQLDQQIMLDGLAKRVVPCDDSGKLEMHEEHRFVVRDKNENPIGLGCFAFEVTEKSLVEETLAQAQRLAKLGSWHWSIRNNNLISCSDNLVEMLGIDMKSAFALMPNRLENFVYYEDRERIAPIIAEIATGSVGAYEMEYRIVDAKNKLLTVRENAEPLTRKDGKTVEYIVTLQDISQQKKIETELVEANQLLESRVVQRTADLKLLAEHDQLTGLLNRNAFIDKILNDLPYVSDSEEIIFFVLDLDGFKGINDCFGHFVGDEVLKAIAERIKTVANLDGLVARIGGDEFGLAIPVKKKAKSEAHAMFNDIDALVRNTIYVENFQLHVGLCAGFAIAKRNERAIIDAMKFADIAMYRAKKAKSKRVIAYEHKMMKEIQFRKRLERDLDKAVLNGEIYTVYQSQHHTVSGELKGFEVLARWEHPELGNIPPETFIRAAEECGLINELSDYILHRGCNEMFQMMKTTGQEFTVSINLSTAQFYNRNLLNTIKSALSDSQLPPNLLELEITESLFMRNTDRTQFFLRKIREAGIRIALDDFGTGYSSLSYLHQFKVDTIKLDRSFIKEITTDKFSKNIVEGIISLANSLELTVVAEGVENQAQLEILKDQNCQIVQGFLYGQPMKIGELMDLFRSEQAHRKNGLFFMNEKIIAIQNVA